jgi:hypothetical protein
VREIVGAVYEKTTGKALTEDEYRVLMKGHAALVLYLAANVYGLYQRSMKVDNYSRKHASGMDMAQAVYLSLCDRFVTNDARQCRGLRLVKQFIKKAERPRVILLLA